MIEAWDERGEQLPQNDAEPDLTARPSGNRSEH